MKSFSLLFLFISSIYGHTESYEIHTTLNNVTSDYNDNSHIPILKQHSLIPPFLNGYWQDGISHWDFYDSAVVTNDYIRLTPDVKGSYGSLWNLEKIPNQAMSDSEFKVHSRYYDDYERSGWQFALSFRIWSQKSIGADGLALFLTDEIPEQKNGPLLGHPNEFTGVAIIFDTFDNNHNGDTPSVRVLQGNIKKYIQSDATHEIISTKYQKKGDIHHQRVEMIRSPHLENYHEWNKENDFDDVHIGKCRFDFRSKRGSDKHDIVSVYIQITHDSKLTIYYSFNEGSDSESCMDEIPITLPPNFHLGISSHTGGITDHHDIHSFYAISDIPKNHSHYKIRSKNIGKFSHFKDLFLQKLWRPKTEEESEESKLEEDKDEHVEDGDESGSLWEKLLDPIQRDVILKKIEDPKFSHVKSYVLQLAEKASQANKEKKSGFQSNKESQENSYKAM